MFTKVPQFENPISSFFVGSDCEHLGILGPHQTKGRTVASPVGWRASVKQFGETRAVEAETDQGGSNPGVGAESQTRRALGGPQRPVHGESGELVQAVHRGL